MEWVIVAIVVLVIGLIAGLLLGGQKPPQVQDQALQIPNTEIGIPIGILFGTRMVRDLTVAWWGDLSIVKIKVDAKGKK